MQFSAAKNLDGHLVVVETDSEHYLGVARVSVAATLAVARVANIADNGSAVMR